MSQQDSFAQYMSRILNHSALNLALALGYKTRLFDVMQDMSKPHRAQTIAARAGLNVRYVREWLGVMVCGKIIEVISGEDVPDRFFLPPDHAALLTRNAGATNLGVYTQEIPLLTVCAMEAVLDGFYTGKGVSYANYPTFQRFMSQLANAKHQQTLIDKFLPSIDAGRMLQDLHRGLRVCDLGCGEGVALMLMAEAFPASKFVGIDIDNDVIHKARVAADQQKLANIDFFQADAARLKEDHKWHASFDYITAFDAIHDQTQPLEALKSVYALLKPKGVFSMVDIAASSQIAQNRNHPLGPFLYTVSLMHCMPVGLNDGGTGLGMMWGEQRAVEYLRKAGFKDIRVLDIPEDPFNLHYLCLKPG